MLESFENPLSKPLYPSSEPVAIPPRPTSNVENHSPETAISPQDDSCCSTSTSPLSPLPQKPPSLFLLLGRKKSTVPTSSVAPHPLSQAIDSISPPRSEPSQSSIPRTTTINFQSYSP